MPRRAEGGQCLCQKGDQYRADTELERGLGQNQPQIRFDREIEEAAGRADQPGYREAERQTDRQREQAETEGLQAGDARHLPHRRAPAAQNRHLVALPGNRQTDHQADKCQQQTDDRHAECVKKRCQQAAGALITAQRVQRRDAQLAVGHQ